MPKLLTQVTEPKTSTEREESAPTTIVLVSPTTTWSRWNLFGKTFLFAGCKKKINYFKHLMKKERSMITQTRVYFFD
jgi:hypothetical protein